jgi:uncharacterized phage protein gp47/JayE
MKKKTAVNSPVAQRMMETGLKPEAHDSYRARFFPAMSVVHGKGGEAGEEIC